MEKSAASMVARASVHRRKSNFEVNCWVGIRKDINPNKCKGKRKFECVYDRIGIVKIVRDNNRYKVLIVQGEDAGHTKCFCSNQLKLMPDPPFSTDDYGNFISADGTIILEAQTSTLAEEEADPSDR